MRRTHTRTTAQARRSLWMIFRIPLLLAALGVIGLLSALVGDGIWDGVSWVCLGIPVVITAVRWRAGDSTKDVDP